jgi:hypothetical protein
MTDKSHKVAGLADYLVFQTHFDVETLRRRATQPRPAISKLELRDSRVKMRNTPLGSFFLAAGHIWFSGSTATVRIRNWCFFGGNTYGKRKVMAMVGQDLWRFQAPGLVLLGAWVLFIEILCCIIKVTFVFDLELVFMS